jgi:molybdenum cofactor biosynthesis protein MoaC
LFDRVKDVGGKAVTSRTARAEATLRAPAQCIALLRSGETEKGDPLKTARIAGILAAKRTPELIPLCHPLPLDHVDVTFDLEDDRALVRATVSATARTGVEMEALTAAAVAALTLYDMLKPYCDPGEIALAGCRLVLKTGGRSSFRAESREIG